jgi:hypothetical protein
MRAWGAPVWAAQVTGSKFEVKGLGNFIISVQTYQANAYPVVSSD